LVYGFHERAKQFATELLNSGFQVLNDVAFNQVLAACENNDVTSKTLELVQELRECWCGGAVWNSKKVIRISICSWATTTNDVTRSVQAFVKAREIARSILK
jgi:threonine aldolase